MNLLCPRSEVSNVSKVSQGWCLWHSGTLRARDEREVFVILRAAALYGCLDVLKLWRVRSQSETLWTVRVCFSAAWGGQVEMLKWLRSQDPPCPYWNNAYDSACSYAALRGHMDALRWLRSQDPPCPFDYHCCPSAARGGHLEVLQWLWGQEGCERREGKCIVEAEQEGHTHIVRWIDEQDD